MTHTTPIEDLPADVEALAEAVGLAITNWPTASEFWAGCEAHEIRVPICESCEAVNWYPRDFCAECLASAFRWVDVGHSAHIYTWTTVHFPFVDTLKDHLPYITGLVQINSANLPKNLIVRLSFSLPARYRVHVGMEMTASFFHVAKSTVPMFLPVGDVPA